MEHEEHREHGHQVGRVEKGHYYTAINVHNPADKATFVRFKFAAALPGGKPGPVSRFEEITLGPDQVISIDCARMYEMLHGHPDEFIDGFAVIESDADLDVVAVYTAGEHETVRTLHTERVPARLLQ
jgi:hypothetical protein